MRSHKYILVNEFSGNQNGQKVLEKVMNFFSTHRIPYTVWKSEYPGHIELITKKIANKAQEHIELIVIGGDGTLNEVIKTLISNNKKIPITYFPAGRGNDFNRTWQSSHDPSQLLEKYLLQRNYQEIPIFTLRKNKQFYGAAINSLGFGFDGVVNQQIESWAKNPILKKLANSKLSYTISALVGLFNLPKYHFTLCLNDTILELENCQMLCMMNSPYFGGGIRLHSQVKKDNKEISLIAFSNVSTWQFLKIFVQIILLKGDVKSNHLQLIKCQHLEICPQQKVLGQVDGELISNNQETLTINLETFPFYLM